MFSSRPPRGKPSEKMEQAEQQRRAKTPEGSVWPIPGDIHLQPFEWSFVQARKTRDLRQEGSPAPAQVAAAQIGSPSPERPAGAKKKGNRAKRNGVRLKKTERLPPAAGPVDQDAAGPPPRGAERQMHTTLEYLAQTSRFLSAWAGSTTPCPSEQALSLPPRRPTPDVWRSGWPMFRSRPRGDQSQPRDEQALGEIWDGQALLRAKTPNDDHRWSSLAGGAMVPPHGYLRPPSCPPAVGGRGSSSSKPAFGAARGAAHRKAAPQTSPREEVISRGPPRPQTAFGHYSATAPDRRESKRLFGKDRFRKGPGKRVGLTEEEDRLALRGIWKREWLAQKGII